MGSHGHLELILNDGTSKKAETYHDGPVYVVNVLQELAILLGRENKSIADIDLQRWFDTLLDVTRSKVVPDYESPGADYCTINQKERKVDVDSSFIYDGDNISRPDHRRLDIDLENPRASGFNYDPGSLKAALKILVRRDAVFWKDGPLQESYYSDKIDSPIPFSAQPRELLLVNSIKGRPVLFEFDGENFNHREYNK